ncbi:hypothetical protein EXY72_01220 [Burkholderia pseudomallei]|nr:hypothetical protein EXY72_01220 [Burkholderia pseudomallei]
MRRAATKQFKSTHDEFDPKKIIKIRPAILPGHAISLNKIRRTPPYLINQDIEFTCTLFNSIDMPPGSFRARRLFPAAPSFARRLRENSVRPGKTDCPEPSIRSLQFLTIRRFA